MRYLITGGAGFMGSDFIRYLFESEAEVEVLNLDKLTYCGNLENLKSVEKNGHYQFVKGDIADRAIVRKTISTFKPDVIVNFAAESHVDRSIADPDAFLHTAVMGTYRLLEAVREFEIPRYVQISTDEVYGSITDGEFTEQSPMVPSSPYSAAKASADLIVQAYWKTYRTPVLITHSCNNFGPFQYPEKVIPLFITNLIEGKHVPLYGTGENVREWIFVRDHSRAIETIVKTGMLGQAYNISTGERCTNNDLTRRIVKAFDYDDTWIDQVKDRPGHDLRYAVDSTKLRALGWKPDVNFIDGLDTTIEWYRRNPEWWKKIKSGEYQKYYQQQYGQATAAKP